MCSKTVQPPGGTVVLLLFPCTLSFPEKVCVFMIVWINPCLPVHPAGEPSGEVMRGPSWETGWRKRCRERDGEREGRGGENNTKLTPHCRGRKKIFNACVQRICTLSFIWNWDLILHLKLPTTRSNFQNVSSILQHVPWSWFEGMVHLKKKILTPSCSFKTVWLLWKTKEKFSRMLELFSLWH